MTIPNSGIDLKRPIARSLAAAAALLLSTLSLGAALAALAGTTVA